MASDNYKEQWCPECLTCVHSFTPCLIWVLWKTVLCPIPGQWEWGRREVRQILALLVQNTCSENWPQRLLNGERGRIFLSSHIFHSFLGKVCLLGTNFVPLWAVIPSPLWGSLWGGHIPHPVAWIFIQVWVWIQSFSRSIRSSPGTLELLYVPPQWAISAIPNLAVRKRPRLLGMTTVVAPRGLHEWPITQELVELRETEEAHKMCPIDFST